MRRQDPASTFIPPLPAVLEARDALPLIAVLSHPFSPGRQSSSSAGLATSSDAIPPQPQRTPWTRDLDDLNLWPLPYQVDRGKSSMSANQLWALADRPLRFADYRRCSRLLVSAADVRR
jgi:hypothetical protein